MDFAHWFLLVWTALVLYAFGQIWLGAVPQLPALANRLLPLSQAATNGALTPPPRGPACRDRAVPAVLGRT